MISKPLLLCVIVLELAPSLGLAQSAASPGMTPAAPPAIATPPKNPLADLYPPRAQRMEVEGEASIRCVVATDGALTSCVVVSERPAGYGFGDATIQASHRWRMKPQMRNGAPVEGVVTIPMRWRLGHDKPQVAPPASNDEPPNL